MATARELLRRIKKSEKLIEMAEELTESVKNECHCPEKYREKDLYYFPGSFNDTAYTDHIIKCSICNKVHDCITENHSWFG